MNTPTPGQACAHCARIKQRCDGGIPCSRCARLGHTCEAQVRGADMDLRSTQARTQAQTQMRRPRATRSRAGCLSCKERKKKCDETRPRCSDCRRLNLACRWWSRTPVSSSGDLESRSPSQNVPISDMTTTALDTSSSWGAPSDEMSNDSPSLSGSASFERSFGSNLDWWAEMDMVVTPVASPGRDIPYLYNEEDRSLFNHYLHIVARALSRSGNTDSTVNPFLTTLVPMAAASDTLTSVLLGLSGCHWRRVYPDIWKRALTRQGRALSQVSQLLSRRDGPCPYTLEACATVLLLCLTELCDGSSRVWKWHLKAARTLLASATEAETTAEGKFCLSLFHYLDSMSTISRCKPPLLHKGQGDSSLADLIATTTNPSVELQPRSLRPADAVSGMAPALLDLLGMVNLLAAHRSRRVDELSDLGFRTAAAQIQARLDNWRTAYDESLLGMRGEQTDTVNDRNDSKNSDAAFEWAIRLRLHQIVDGYDPRHPAVETALERILQAVLSVPYGSPVEGSLLFPLVIAGASSTVVERRMVVKERLMVMENTLGFGHIRRARELLETVWAEEEEQGEWNWAWVRYSRFPGVVFI